MHPFSARDPAAAVRSEKEPGAPIAGAALDGSCRSRASSRAEPGALAATPALGASKQRIQAFESGGRVAQLEQLLLRGQRQRHDLGEARAHPGGRIEAMRRLE